MKKLCNVVGIILAMCMLIPNPVRVFASENVIAANTLLELSQDAEVYEKDNGEGTLLTTLEAGTPVISAEDINLSTSSDTWCKITYQEITGYVQITTLKQYIAEDATKEFDSISNTNKLVFEEVEYNKTQSKQKMIWTGIIAVLVVAIFAVGIVSVVNKNVAQAKQQGKRKKRREPKDETDHSDTML